MPKAPRDHFYALPEYQPVLRELGFDASSIFENPRIIPWRTLPDRQNCTLDEDLSSGVHIRWHIKRFFPQNPPIPMVDDELRGHRALTLAGIPTAVLIGHGQMGDGRGFVIFDDLTGYKPADKLVEAGIPFASLLEPTADLAAMLHARGLHHRDLYLCHFMARLVGANADIRLIDAARVWRLPGVLTRGRWIVKDLAQFWYSTLRLPITDLQREEWLQRYARQRGIGRVGALQRRIERKSRSIARHDIRLHRDRPERDVSIPT